MDKKIVLGFLFSLFLRRGKSIAILIFKIEMYLRHNKYFCSILISPIQKEKFKETNFRSTRWKFFTHYRPSK